MYWHFGHPKLLNRHLLVFGKSGTGKTYGIQCLLAEMAVAGLRSLIVDYTDGFLPAQMEPRFKEIAQPKNHFVYSRAPAAESVSAPTPGDRSVDARVRRNQLSGGLPYRQHLHVGLRGRRTTAGGAEPLAAGGAGDRARASRWTHCCRSCSEDGPHGLSLANKIEPFIQARPFRGDVESAWEDMLSAPDHGVHVLQLKGLGARDPDAWSRSSCSGICGTTPRTREQESTAPDRAGRDPEPGSQQRFAHRQDAARGPQVRHRADAGDSDHEQLQRRAARPAVPGRPQAVLQARGHRDRSLCRTFCRRRHRA